MLSICQLFVVKDYQNATFCREGCLFRTDIAFCLAAEPYVRGKQCAYNDRRSCTADKIAALQHMSPEGNTRGECKVAEPCTKITKSESRSIASSI